MPSQLRLRITKHQVASELLLNTDTSAPIELSSRPISNLDPRSQTRFPLWSSFMDLIHNNDPLAELRQSEEFRGKLYIQGFTSLHNRSTSGSSNSRRSIRNNLFQNSLIKLDRRPGTRRRTPVWETLHVERSNRKLSRALGPSFEGQTPPGSVQALDKRHVSHYLAEKGFGSLWKQISWQNGQIQYVTERVIAKYPFVVPRIKHA
jgi:hypothetical protein